MMMKQVHRLPKPIKTNQNRFCFMKFYLLTLILSVLSLSGFSQKTTVNPEEVVRRVADYVVNNTSFKFVNKDNKKEYESTLGLASDLSLKVASQYNDWVYGNGVLNIGLVRLGNELNDKKYTDYSLHNFNFIFDNLPYFKAQYEKNPRNTQYFRLFRMGSLDDCGAMAASLVDVYNFSNNKQFREYIDRAANYVESGQIRLPDSTLVRDNPREFTIWADDLYMSVPLLARMGKLTGNNHYFDDAVRQVENFTRYLYDAHTGLYFHCWYSKENMNGVAHWGRCNGWIAMAEVELLNNLPENYPQRQIIIDLLLRQIVGVSRYQDVSGLWHQVLDKSDSYLETSCTAMFVYAIARAVNQGWIDKGYMSVAKNGWKGLVSKINPDGQVQDVCIGTGIDDGISFYYNRPAQLNDIHALGAVLLAGIEINKAQK